MRICIFDMDGTVLDTIGDISDALNRSLIKMNKKTHTEEEYKKMVGDGMNVLCRRAIPDATDSEVSELISLYKEDYLKNCCVRTKPYEGIEKLISDLDEIGIKSVILSNKPHIQAIEISDKLKMSNLFLEILGKKDEFPAKPDPTSILYLIDKYCKGAEEVVYIGDSNVDMILGKSVNAYTVGVSWGFRDVCELVESGADEVANTSDELYNIIKNFFEKKGKKLLTKN